ncbi:MAG: septum formation initiator family protein [Bacteroidota bacterium]
MNQIRVFFSRVGARILQTAGTKYILAFLIAAVWMVFFDRYNLISQHKLDQQIEELQEDRDFYIQVIEEIDLEASRLQKDPEAIERFAREKYYMKRPGEDVYVIVEE